MNRLCVAMSLAAAIFFLALLVPVAGVAADQAEQTRMYSKFIHHMHDKEYEQAVELLYARAKAGDGWAKAMLADWFSGSGDPGDAPPQLVRLMDARLDKALKAGDPDAQFTLGMRALKSGDPANLARGVELLEKAADQGQQGALFVLGQMSRKALAARGIASRHAGLE